MADLNLRFLKAFPKDFTFGAATSSYQIEGRQFGGCGRSHWDDFAAKDGRTYQGQDGAIACDHYHHWQEDIGLCAQGGFNAYRFSFSWARLLPEDNTQVNQQGLAFYDRLLDGLLARGLQPFATLYHWELPSRLADDGGWTNKETVKHFADYTALIMRHFGDRLSYVAPINEPWCVAWLSHYWGEHAPGLRDINAAVKAMHYIQLAHGMSVKVIREYEHIKIGCVLNKEYAQPIDERPLSLEKADLFDAIYNRWFEESIFKGRYPSPALDIFAPYMPADYADDLAIICAPLDWVGVNYYTRAIIAPDENEPIIGFSCERGELIKTDMGWEVYPEGIAFFVRRLVAEYASKLPIYITENGMANRDVITGSGVNDDARIDYYAQHLRQIKILLDEGVPIEGYFAWSLLDNYEWAYGYSKRFGLVHVDFDSQLRTPKKSYFAWQSALQSRQ